MTVVCAYHCSRSNTTVVGADSRATLGRLKMPTSDCKWVSVGNKNGYNQEFMVGFSGGIRLRSAFHNLNRHDLTSFEMIIGALESLHSRLGVGSDDHHLDGEMIVASAHRVWHVSGDLSVVTIDNDCLFAIGSGYQFAMGAAYRTKAADPEYIVKKSIECAIHYDNMCGGDIFVSRIIPK